MTSLLGNIESSFDMEHVLVDVKRYWHWSVYISVAYLLSIFGLQRWMENRGKYNLRRALFIWSMTLSLFSAYGFYQCGVEYLKYFYTHGWEKATCTVVIFEKRPGLWSFLFCFFKLPELLDTYFIVLRKQKLIFLHWYHHITVFIYCWYHCAYKTAPDQWFIIVNYFVHAVMYFYFAVRASGSYRPPIWVNMSITLIQLFQMVFGSYVNIYVFKRMTADPVWNCDNKPYLGLLWAFAMYGSYFVLFAHFFVKTYVKS